MNIALTEDLPREQEKIQRILTEYAAICHIPLSVSVFNNAEDLMADYRPLRYSAIFLDIYMDGMNGIEAAQKIRETDKDALIVFLTTSREHMPDAFRLHAYEYIIKPVCREDLFLVMDDILRRTTPANAPVFAFTSHQTDVSVSYDDLVLIETDHHNYLKITEKAGNIHLTRMTFQAARKLLLQDKRFLLVRRGVIVNMSYIRKFKGALCYLAVGDPIPISQRHEKHLEQTWDNYLMDKMRSDILKGVR